MTTEEMVSDESLIIQTVMMINLDTGNINPKYRCVGVLIINSITDAMRGLCYHSVSSSVMVIVLCTFPADEVMRIASLIRVCDNDKITAKYIQS
jgi:hypothetical protein